MNPERFTARHITIKMSKVERHLKTAREKQLVKYKETPIKPLADLWAEILQARRKHHDLFKVTKGKKFQPRILYPARLSFRIKGEFSREAKAEGIHHH